MKNTILIILASFIGFNVQAASVDVKLNCDSAPKIRSGVLNFPFEKSEWSLTYGSSPISGEVECRIKANSPISLTIDGVTFVADHPELFESYPAKEAKTFCEDNWSKSGPNLFSQSGFDLISLQNVKINYLIRRVEANRFLPDGTIVIRDFNYCDLSSN